MKIEFKTYNKPRGKDKEPLQKVVAFRDGVEVGKTSWQERGEKLNAAVDRLVRRVKEKETDLHARKPDLRLQNAFATNLIEAIKD